MKKIFSLSIFTILSLLSFSQLYIGLSDYTGKVLCSTIDSSNGNIYIGGYLPTLGNLARSTDGGLSFQSIATTNDTVFDLIFYQNVLWFGGNFTTVNGQPNKFFSRYNPSTNLIDTVIRNNRFFGTGVRDFEIFQPTNLLLMCGDIGNPTDYPSGGAPYYFGNNIFKPFSNFAHSIYKMAADSSNLYAYYYNAPSFNYYIQALVAGVWQGVGSLQFLTPCKDLRLFNNKLYIVGNFGIFTEPALNFGGYSGLIDSTITECITVSNGNLYFGGQKFLKYDGTILTNLGTSNGLINELLPWDSIIYIIGAYNSINGQSLKNVSKYQSFQIANANFTSSVSVFCGNGTVNFTNTSAGVGMSYQWYFQGGSPPTSTSSNPSVTYSTVGTFSVTLIVTNPAGNDTAITDNLVVINPIPPQPTINKSGDTLYSSAATGNQWILNNNNIGGATAQFYHPAQNGNYQVRYTDVNGCSNISSNYAFTLDTIATGFGREISAGKILLYPNPTNDFIRVINEEPFEVFDPLGSSLGVYLEVADLRALNASSYFIRLKSGQVFRVIKY